MMMEGESSTPVAERVPDEETAFVKKVEAPKRRQSRMRAKKKRLAVAGVSVVALVALAGMCAFVALSSESPNETNVVESEVMATDPAKEQFVPSFDNYDTDGNGKVSLGEYLDGFAANWGAALEKVETAGLDGAKRSRIDQYLDEDFAEHSNCVVRFAQQNDKSDALMTRENFDQVYEQLTTQTCPLRDTRIPGSYQFAKMATKIDQRLPIAASPESEDSSNTLGWSSGEGEWSPEIPTNPPTSSHSGERSSTSSQFNEGEQWNPDLPANLPLSSTSDWNPDEPTNPPTGEEKSGNGSNSASQSDHNDQWNPDAPIEVPDTSRGEESNADASQATSISSNDETEWRPNEPSYPPSSEKRWNPSELISSPAAFSDYDTSSQSSSSQSNEDHEWEPSEPSNPPTLSITRDAQPENSSNDRIEATWSPGYPVNPPSPSQ